LTIKFGQDKKSAAYSIVKELLYLSISLKAKEIFFLYMSLRAERSNLMGLLRHCVPHNDKWWS